MPDYGPSDRGSVSGTDSGLLLWSCVSRLAVGPIVTGG